MQIKEDVALYKDIMQFFIMDDGYYPESNSAEFQQGFQRQAFHPGHILQVQFQFTQQ